MAEKSCQFFSKLAQKVATTVSLETGMIFKIAQNVTRYLDYFCMKILFPTPLKIAQSDHSDNSRLAANKVSFN